MTGSENRTRLVLIGGAPGVGKSAVAREILSRLDNCVWLDGDDLWRMNPFVVNTKTRRMVERNAKAVLRSFIAEGFSTVLFTWVLHRQSIAKRIIAGLPKSKYRLFHFTLVCSDRTLKTRIDSDGSGRRDVHLAIDRLRKTRLLSSMKVQTDGKTPNRIAKEILEHLSI